MDKLEGERAMEAAMEKAYRICLQKTDLHMKMLTEVCEYYSSVSGDYYADSQRVSFFDTVWMPSFFTGIPLLAFRTEGDMRYIRWASKHGRAYRDKIFRHPMNTHHDLGFIYSPFSVALYRLTGDETQREAALKAADELAKRFHLDGRFIEAWQRMDTEENRGLYIIDCMMNLPLLFWAWKETGHTFYRDAAAAHADTTLAHLLREDGSAYHAGRYNAADGMWKPENYCGFGVESHWARGSAWAIYGFALAHGYTGNPKYLEAAIKIADKFASCLTEEDGVPVWDFRLPAEAPAKMCPARADKTAPWDETDPANKRYNRDTSAAAITADGMLEILKYSESRLLSDTADALLSALCAEAYLDAEPTRAGLLRCSNGCMTYTPFGDYFFMEALQKRLYHTETCW